MSTNSKPVIHDTCILLDLVELNLLDTFFQLGYKVITTPQVTSEITNDIQRTKIAIHVDNKTLLIDSDGSIETITQVLAENNGLSFTDGSVYELGIRKQGIILSSDSSLRKCCENAGIEVHGMLWIIQQLLVNGHIDCEFACRCLRQYSVINPWAPHATIETMIDDLMN